MPVIAQWLSIIAVIPIGLILLAVAAFLYSSRQVMHLPQNNPASFLRRGRGPACRRVIVCAGASMVQGRVGSSFVDLLAERFPDDCLVNAGYNGDMAVHLLRRLDEVIACQPDVVAILVGSNDVIGTLDSETWRRYQGEKALDGPPSLNQYREAMAQIVRRLRQATSAPIALCALPVLGEDLGSPPNRRVQEFNAAIREVAAAEGAAYLPVFEREAALLAARADHAGKAFVPRFGVYGRIMFLAMIQHYVLGRSFDDIARRSGNLLKTDLIHGNSREASVITDEIASFLSGIENQAQ